MDLYIYICVCIYVCTRAILVAPQAACRKLGAPTGVKNRIWVSDSTRVGKAASGDTCVV